MWYCTRSTDSRAAKACHVTICRRLISRLPRSGSCVCVLFERVVVACPTSGLEYWRTQSAKSRNQDNVGRYNVLKPEFWHEFVWARSCWMVSCWIWQQPDCVVLLSSFLKQFPRRRFIPPQNKVAAYFLELSLARVLWLLLLIPKQAKHSIGYQPFADHAVISLFSQCSSERAYLRVLNTTWPTLLPRTYQQITHSNSTMQLTCLQKRNTNAHGIITCSVPLLWDQYSTAQ